MVSDNIILISDKSIIISHSWVYRIPKITREECRVQLGGWAGEMTMDWLFFRDSYLTHG